MIAVLSLLVVLVLSMTVVRVAAVALSLTGVSRELARFQARSAFTGAGFTTTESEQVVGHPVRRKIIMWLMLLGNAGIVTVMSSLVLSFVTLEPEASITGRIWFRLLLLIAGLAFLWLVARSRWLDRRLSRLVAWALKRWANLDVCDYAGLLHLSKGYVVSELLVEDQDWLAGHTLTELRLADEGLLVLGVEKPDRTYFGAPRGQTRVETGDTLYLYGPTDLIASLDRRRADYQGNRDHREAVDRQVKIEAEELQVQRDREAAGEPDSPASE
jgi:hypothetical protein